MILFQKYDNLQMHFYPHTPNNTGVADPGPELVEFGFLDLPHPTAWSLLKPTPPAPLLPPLIPTERRDEKCLGGNK